MNFVNCVLILLDSRNLLLVRAIDLAIAGWLAGLVLISSGIMTGEPGMVSPCSALCQRVTRMVVWPQWLRLLLLSPWYCCGVLRSVGIENWVQWGKRFV